jgi:hypothetical protein
MVVATVRVLIVWRIKVGYVKLLISELFGDPLRVVAKNRIILTIITEDGRSQDKIAGDAVEGCFCLAAPSIMKTLEHATGVAGVAGLI